MEPGVKAVLLLFFLVCFACNVAGSTRTQADKRDQPRWCGKKLMDILKKLCNHCFNYKRSLGFHENWGKFTALFTIVYEAGHWTILIFQEKMKLHLYLVTILTVWNQRVHGIQEKETPSSASVVTRTVLLTIWRPTVVKMISLAICAQITTDKTSVPSRNLAVIKCL